jgi:hypothetical protein
MLKEITSTQKQKIILFVTLHFSINKLKIEINFIESEIKIQNPELQLNS